MMKHLRQYIRSIIAEMATPRQTDLDAVYYHGTPTTENAESIMAIGIKVPDLSAREGYMRPVDGKIYITPEIRYAQIYALGGDVAGSQNDWLTERYGQYGYVFAIDGQQLKDIQPDEDSVGEMVHNEEVEWLDDIARDVLEYEEYDDFDQDLGYGNLYDAVMGGEYDAWAHGGKIILDVLTDKQKLELIDLGAHVAHSGNLFPKETWRFDRDKMSDLARDGSNFFELAEKIQ